MKATAWQYFIVGGTLGIASTAAAQAPAEGSADTRAQPETPTDTPAEGSGEAPAPAESATEPSVPTESSAAPPAPIQEATPPRTKTERADPGIDPGLDPGLDPGIEELGDLSLVELMDVEVTGAGFFALRYNLALALPLLGDLRAVEVVQGPGSILHGSGSITGSVNMLPKTGRSNPGVELATEFGPFDDANTVEAGYGTTYGPSARNELYIYGGIARAGGFTPNTHDWTADDESANVQGRLQPSGKTTVNWQHGALRVKAQYVDMWSSQGAGVSGEEPTGWHEGYLAVQPEYVLALAPKHDLDIIAGAVLHESGFSKRDERTLVPNQVVTTEPGETQQSLPYTQRESHYVGRLVYKVQALKGHKIAAGGEVGTREFTGNKAWFHPLERNAAFDSESRWNEFSAFCEDVIEWGNLLAAVGLRYDVVDFRGGYFVADDSYDRIPKDQVSAVSPRVSVAYEFITGLSARIAYQRGFRAADASNLQENRRLTGPNNSKWVPVGEFGGPTWTAPPAVVAPETVDSVDLNMHGQTSLRDVNLIGDINVHYQSFDQYILYNVGWRNASSRFSSVGGEVVGKVQTNRGDLAQLSYAYSQPVGLDEETARELQLTNDDRTEWRLYYRHQIKLSGVLVVPGFDKQLALGTAFRYYSPLPTWDAQQSLAATADPTWDESARSEPLIAVSASATFDVTPKLQLALLGQNLYHNGTPAADAYAGHPEVTAVGLDNTLIYLRLRALLD
jgi:outer membrane receptor protein involved in Fe transport